MLYYILLILARKEKLCSSMQIVAIAWTFLCSSNHASIYKLVF